ncbi:MAG: hypothetical protein AB7V26_09605 [Lysobacterales bacterium]
MKTLITSVLLGLAASAAFALPAEVMGPVYVPGQYSARLNQANQEWRLMPIAEADQFAVNHDPACLSTAVLPNGLWLVVHKPLGGLELVAASDTPLAADQAPTVPLLRCGEAASGLAVRAPDAVFDVLAERVGAVLIDG